MRTESRFLQINSLTICLLAFSCLVLVSGTLSGNGERYSPSFDSLNFHFQDPGTSGRSESPSDFDYSQIGYFEELSPAEEEVNAYEEVSEYEYIALSGYFFEQPKINLASMSSSRDDKNDYLLATYVRSSPSSLGQSCPPSCRQNPLGWLHHFEVGMYANESNFVFAAGAQATLLESCHRYYGLRALGTNSDLEEASSHGGFSLDWFAAQPRYLRGRQCDYIKYGAFHDQQSDLSQTGFSLGAILITDYCRPLTLDAAIGFGAGSDKATAVGSVEAAEHDYQLRLGTYLSPCFQTGVSAYYADWRDNLGDAYGVGAFAIVELRRVSLQLDITAGDEGVDGFVNLVFVPGAWSRGCCVSDRCYCRCCQCCPCLPSAWLARPVTRNLAIRTRLRPNPGGGLD